MRRIRVFLVGISVLLLPTVAGAQTKISGTAKCKAHIQSTVEVGDRPNHSFSVSQGKCTWVKPWTIEGIQNKKGTFTEITEITGNSSQARGYYLDTMANGDKVHYRYENNVTWCVSSRAYTAPSQATFCFLIGCTNRGASGSIWFLASDSGSLPFIFATTIS